METKQTLNSNGYQYKGAEVLEALKQQNKHYLCESIFDKASIIKDNHKEFMQLLIEAFDFFSPLIYLTTEQKNILINNILFIKFEEKHILYETNLKTVDHHLPCFLLIKGEVHIYDDKNNFTDMIKEITLFGYDGPIFNKRLNTVLVEKDSVLGVIPGNRFLESLCPISKFSTFISRNIIHKDKVLDDLTKIKNFIINYIDKGVINMTKLEEVYKSINPCIHPHASAECLDLNAWNYALNRLPTNLFETFVFVVLNKPPKILQTDEKFSKENIPKIITNARNRDVYRYLDGKNLIIVREMETDVLDFVCNMCIHMIESKKLRKLVNNPIIISKLYEAKDNLDETVKILDTLKGNVLKEKDIMGLKKTFGTTLPSKLIALALHYQDYTISMLKQPSTDKDPVEKWIQNLWKSSKELLGVNSSVDEIDDLVVDLMQGSKKTLLGCLSPHVYKHRDEILSWAKEQNIQTKTKIFHNDNDILLAYSYYYYLAFPEKAKEKEEMDKAHGIKIINQTFSTGVQVILINPNKLDKNNVDPMLNLKPASKNHLLLHIGYTFGAQSAQIIKPILMLFGSKARSLNVIGKCGGLIGNRTDILIATKIFYDKTHELANLYYGNLDMEDLKNTVHSKFHVGPMLTVAGTILQNTDILNFYKNVMGCIGLEMEGFFFVKEIENAVKHNILSKDFITRCFYYSSDIPLDPSQTLSVEGDNVCWNEGICSMNAIQRFILKQLIC